MLSREAPSSRRVVGTVFNIKLKLTVHVTPLVFLRCHVSISGDVSSTGARSPFSAVSLSLRIEQYESC